MTQADAFIAFLKDAGCDVVVTQPDDNSGYTVMTVETHSGKIFDITVHE